MTVTAIQPPSCYRCHSREWNDGLHISETLILFLLPDGKTKREGRKYYEERDMSWQCANGHPARPQTQDRLERMLERAEELQI